MFPLPQSSSSRTKPTSSTPCPLPPTLTLCCAASQRTPRHRCGPRSASVAAQSSTKSSAGCPPSPYAQRDLYYRPQPAACQVPTLRETRTTDLSLLPAKSLRSERLILQTSRRKLWSLQQCVSVCVDEWVYYYMQRNKLKSGLCRLIVNGLHLYSAFLTSGHSKRFTA